MSTKNSSIKVLITGASPDRINTNATLRSYVYAGFASVIGGEQVANCPLETSVEFVSRFRPDLIVCFGSCMPDESEYGPLRDICDRTGTVIAFWLHDDPYEFDYSFKAEEVADWIFSNDRWSTLHYQHPKVYHLPMAACPNTHRRTWTATKENDVFFCGVGFSNRTLLVRDLEKKLESVRTCIMGTEWPEDMLFTKNERLSNTKLSNAYATSWVTLNMGRNLHLANTRYQLAPSTPGPRTFEAAMAGTVQFYFAESFEITDYFQAESEIVLFNDVGDFTDQLDRLLDEPEWAESIAKSAQKRALKEHTYAHRSIELLNICGFE
jgi:spore maturation protein CgeB